MCIFIINFLNKLIVSKIDTKSVPYVVFVFLQPYKAPPPPFRDTLKFPSLFFAMTPIWYGRIGLLSFITSLNII